jgi:hypothetical protein
MRENGRVDVGARPALLALLLLLSACGVAAPGGGGGGGGTNPRCTTYCRARQTKGCGGDESNCRLACNVDYSAVAPTQGSCTQTYTSLLECKDDPAILEFGCAPPPSKIEEFCKAQGDAYDACVKQRDGT